MAFRYYQSNKSPKRSASDLIQKTPVKKPRHDENQSTSSTPLRVSKSSIKVKQTQNIAKALDEKNGHSEKPHDDNQNKLRDMLSSLEKTTYGLAIKIEPSWYKVIWPEFYKNYFIELSKFVNSERESGTVYPAPEEVFGFTRSIKRKNIKVVIIGQAPYPSPFLANGLPFSVKKGIPVPPTLQNIYKELGLEDQTHGDLQGWADQGVLLLNVCLTVRAYKPNSHKGHGWERFTDAIVSWLSKHRRGIVFMLWGCYAKRKRRFIDKTKHHILMASLPAPQSAERGFFRCNHFEKCNEFLKKEGKKPIDWNNLP